MLMCQVDSYLQEFKSELLQVLDEEFVVCTTPGPSKKVQSKGLILGDTIFFPEGGGQPCDTGRVELLGKDGIVIELQIKYVVWVNDKAVHVIDPDIPLQYDLATYVGTTAYQTLFWPRRERHMLHHSGQHLISALATQMLKFDTLSWCLTSEYCFVELDVEMLAEEEFKELQNQANLVIQKACPVVVHEYKKGDPELLQTAKTRGLPKNQQDTIRVIEIKGIDSNMCCGTHVTNTSKLEAIKFLKTEKKTSKKKTTCLLYFSVGHRTLFKKYDEMLATETTLCKLMNVRPDGLCNAVEKLKITHQESLKRMETVEADVSRLYFTNFSIASPRPPVFALHRPYGTVETMRYTARLFDKMTDVTLFLTVGVESEGSVLLVSTKEDTEDFGQLILQIMGGKGKTTGNRFNGKVCKLEAREEVKNLLIEALRSRTAAG